MKLDSKKYPVSNSEVNRLDNPAWNALTSVQNDFALGSDVAKRFPVHILPFIGLSPSAGNALESLKDWVATGEIVYAIGDLPDVPASWKVLNKLECVQMFCPELPELELDRSVEILKLEVSDKTEMFQLINSVQPGYFKEETPQLGNYYGIKADGKLVAMAGERLKLSGFSELSAVCTHAGYTGRGFAYQLVLKVCKEMTKQGKIPFLHVLESNTRAIQLYERLGFVKRKSIAFWQLKSV